MIKWGVIGTGHMANIFAESIQEIDNAKLVDMKQNDQLVIYIKNDRF